jgi:hypothetical protein
MRTEFSEESRNTHDSDSEDIKSFQDGEDITVTIFDWDNTLFCTQYLEILQVDIKKIFSNEKSLEDFGAYLNHEMQFLEEVNKLFNMN